MDQRDDTHRLLVNNNWYLVVGCIPQINYEDSSYNRDGTYTEELTILTSVLKDKRLRWPQTATLLRAIAQLRRAKKTGHQILEPQSSKSSSVNHEYLPTSTLRQLFPFPEGLCPRMMLLEDLDLEDSILASMEPAVDEDFDWMFTECEHISWDMNLESLMEGDMLTSNP